MTKGPAREISIAVLPLHLRSDVSFQIRQPTTHKYVTDCLRFSEPSVDTTTASGAFLSRAYKPSGE